MLLFGVMAELADAADLKSAAFGREGSTPSSRTKMIIMLCDEFDSYFRNV